MNIPQYRAWHKRHKIMMPVLEINLDPEHGGVFVDSEYTGQCECHLYKDFWPWSDIELMQHTRQEDTKIYEGDILALAEEKLPYTVHWNYDRWGLKNHRDDSYDNGDYYRGDDINNWHEWEVIGNIWEHPELLNERQA